MILNRIEEDNLPKLGYVLSIEYRNRFLRDTTLCIYIASGRLLLYVIIAFYEYKYQYHMNNVIQRMEMKTKLTIRMHTHTYTTCTSMKLIHL